MAFDPPIGSDELSDRLKTAFPEGQTLRQRKYLAAIAFLQAELQQIETEDAALLGPSTPSSFHNTKSLSTRTRHHSHDLLNESQRQSPASYNSPSSAQSASSPSLVDRGRSDADQDPVADARRPSTPNARGATFVFNSVNGRTVKPKTKRKMTQQERRAYKETRIRGACVKCRKTKGKCTHNDDLKAGHLDYNHALPIAEGKNTVEGSPECANLHLSLSEGLSVRNDQSTKSRQPQSSSEPQPTFEDQQVDQFGQRASFVLPSVSDGLWKAGAAPAENSHKYVHPRPATMPFPPDENDHGWPSFHTVEEDYNVSFGTQDHQTSRDTFPSSSPLDCPEDAFVFQTAMFETQHWPSHLGDSGTTQR